MGFSGQEYWSGLPFPPPEDHLDPGIKPVSLVFPALAGGFFTSEPPGKACHSKGSLNHMKCQYFTIFDLLHKGQFQPHDHQAPESLMG